MNTPSEEHPQKYARNTNQHTAKHTATNTTGRNKKRTTQDEKNAREKRRKHMVKTTPVTQAVHSLIFDIQAKQESGASDADLVSFIMIRAKSLYNRHRIEAWSNRGEKLVPLEALHDTYEELQ